MIDKKCDIDINVSYLIKEGLEKEYRRSLDEYHNNNVKQIILLFLGIIFISTLIKDEFIWKEILLISGWVPIWKMIEVELFSDVAGRKKRKTIKKLLNREIIEK